MSRIVRLGRLGVIASLSLFVVVLTVMGVRAAAATSEVDLTLELSAPDHVVVDAEYELNLKYENLGATAAPDVQVVAVLPTGTQFVTSTDRWGAVLVPDVIDGNTLTWSLGPLAAETCCGHILITVKTDAALVEGTALTATASVATTAVESDATNNTAEAVSVICDMAGSVKQVDATEVMPGDVLTYTLQLRYQHRAGEPNQRWVELTDMLPTSQQVRFLGWNGDITGTQHLSQALQWQGLVRAGEPLSLQYRLGIEGEVEPGTIVTNGAQLRWQNGEMQLEPVTTVVTMPQYAHMFGATGGQWQHAYGVDLDVPPQAVTQTTRFQFREMSQTEIISGPPGLMYAHRAFELTAFRFGEVHQFGQPITVTVHYSDSDVSGLNRHSLRLWYRNSAGEPWAMLGEPVRVMSGAVAFETTHFTQFALFAEGVVDAAVDVKAPQSVPPGGEFEVNVAYTSTGAISATNTWLTVTLPAAVQFITATDRWGAILPPDVINGDQLAWRLGTLDAGDCCGHILIIEQANAALANGTLLTNTAEIATDAAEDVLTNNSDSAATEVSQMAGSTKQVHTGWAMPGDVLTYTIVINYPPQPGQPQQRQLMLTDTLPLSQQVRFLGWTGVVTGTQHEGQQVKWQGQIRAGEPITVQYRLGVEGNVAPGTILTNVAYLDWGTGQMQLGPVTTVVTMAQQAYMFGPNGGEWAHQYGLTLTVPPQAVTETTRFQFREMSQTEIISRPPGLMYAHRAFELTAFRFGEVHQFSKPLTITLQYSNTDVGGLKQETLRLWYRNSAGEPWAMLGEPVRVMSGALSFTTTHFTEFALFAAGAYKVQLPLINR